MSSTPAIQPASRASTGALSQQPTLVPSLSQQSSFNNKADPADRAAFTKALDAFRLRLTLDERKSFNNASWETMWKEMIHLQRVQEQRKEMVNLRRIQGFLEGMQQLGKTIEVFLNVNEAVAFIWGPIKFLLLTAATYTDTFDTLLNAYEQIGEALPFLEGVEQLFGDRPLLISALIRVYIDILTFHQRTLRFFDKPKWYRLFKAMWKDFNTEFGGMLKSLHRHKDLVNNRATLSHFEKYRDETEQIQTKLDEIVAGERGKRRTAVVEWLAVEQRAHEDHDELRKIRALYSTTAKWILDREFVKHWLDATIPATPLLWIHGIPGAGKTILASAIIDECKKKQGFSTCFVYCHDGDQNSNSALTIMKEIVVQLLEQHELSILPLVHARKGLSGEPVLRSLQLAKKMFEDCCLAMGKMFVIIDGLDECDLVERKQIIEILMDLVAECDADEEGKLRILIVSQELGDIKRALQSNAAGRLAPRILPIFDNDTRKDISTYVRAWVEKIAIKFSPPDFTDDMKRYLRGLTIENAKGMFLYAKLVMEDLHDQPNREDFLNSIRSETFPKKLEEAYDRIVKRIKRTSSAAEWAMAKRLLGWMVCAKRQLTWKEMQVAVSVDHLNQEIEYDNRRLRTHIHDTCGSLVVVTGERITLVHSTAKSFITTTPDGIHEPSVEIELTILCLQYLTFPCFEKEGIEEDQLKEMMLRGHFAFQDYAVAKWFYHVNAMVKSGKRLLEEAPDRAFYLDNIASATDEFISKYDEIDWDAGIRKECIINCTPFEGQAAHENLVLITSHIYTFQQKGFDLRHKISIKTLEETLDRNRKLLEDFPTAKTTKKDQLEKYEQFYNAKKPFKCNKITCRYFSEGFADKKARKKHVNVHDRPFYCEVENCLGAEGFANNKDLDKHNRAFHPEMSDLGKTFNSATARKAKADYVCTICGKTFTRNFHRKNHELSHRGVRPHACAECGKAFTRMNDMMRHVRTIHERGRA